MGVRGEAHRAAIGAVLDVFGAEARHFAFVGGCVLGLYSLRRANKTNARAAVTQGRRSLSRDACGSQPS